jgi:ankyrin repeat protein
MQHVWNGVLTHRNGSVDECDSNGMRGVHWVCVGDLIACLNVLLEHGANVNQRAGGRPEFYRSTAQYRDKHTPLEFAIRSGARKCARRLIDAGASPSWSTMYEPDDYWLVDYIATRNKLRLAACIILVSYKRGGSLRAMDRHVVKMIAVQVWALKVYCNP